MRIFLAANFGDKQLVSEHARTLKENGHEVYDWTTHPPIRPYEADEDLVKKYSTENIEFIINADVFIFLGDRAYGKNSYVELGVAICSHIMRGRPKIYVVGDFDTMYFFHPSVTHRSSIDQVLSEVTKC